MTADALPAHPGPREVRSIQYLRGIAALGVVIYHACDRAGLGFGVGAAGVDVFFVISGFIMWVVTARVAPSPGAFLIKRLQRIAPLYWAVTLLVAAVASVAPSLFPRMEVTAGHLVQSLLFIPHADPAGEVAPIIVPGWTLNYEMFFYVVFALALLASTRWRAWLVTLALGALVLLRPLVNTDIPILENYTNPLLLEFVAGIWLGNAWTEDRLPGRRWTWVLIVLGILGFAFTELGGFHIHRIRTLAWGLPALLLVAGAVVAERHARVPDLPPLKALGDASYSVYLLHGLAVSATWRILQMLGVSHPALFIPAAVIVGVIVGMIGYRLFEKPMMRLFHTGIAARRKEAAAT